MMKPESREASLFVSVPLGKWAVAASPVVLRTLLGSCVGIALYDRTRKAGGLAHVVLPDSRGASDNPGKYADTAVPAMVADLERLTGVRGPGRLTAKLFGGASMFKESAGIDIGGMNQAAVASILEKMGVVVVAKDLGGDSGRRLTFDTSTGVVNVRIPGGADYEL
jgi:chemotaxis protein CheD